MTRNGGNKVKLYEEIFLKEVRETAMNSPVLKDSIHAEQIIMNACYAALEQIRAILKDDTLDDHDCFQKIEEIVCVYEQLGSDFGSRHDF